MNLVVLFVVVVNYLWREGVSPALTVGGQSVKYNGEEKAG